MKRGDLFVVAPPGHFSKPRPSLVIQHVPIRDPENITVALITSDLLRVPPIRVGIEPTPANGLRKRSEIMIDHIHTVPIGRIGQQIGTVEVDVMTRVDYALRLFFGLEL